MTDEERIAYFKAEKERALGTVRDIEHGHRRFYEAIGSDPLRETTAEYLEEKKRDAETFEGLIRVWEAFVAKRS